MLVLIGASASGKTEIAKRLIANYGFKKMITYTTREKRKGEIDGLDYHFVSEAEFEAKAKENQFLETTQYHNNYYGTAFKDAQKNSVVIVDIPGANHIYEQLNKTVMIIYVETPEHLRKARMLERGDALPTVVERLKTDAIHFNPNHLKQIDAVIKNDAVPLEALTEQIATLYKTHMSTS